MKKDIILTVCVPAYNEEKSLKKAVENLLFTISPHVNMLKIIIVDDGSFDSTSKIADELSKRYSQVDVIHHSKNLGVGASYRSALSKVKEGYFTWFPGDHEDSVDEIVHCLPYIDIDTVVTCHHIEYDSRTLLRRLISRFYTWLLNRYFHFNIKYYNGLSIYPVSILKSLPLVSNGFSLFAENLIHSIRYNYKIVEISTDLNRREWGKSKALSFVSIYCMAKDICKILLRTWQKCS